jgi:hypothetical protein
MAKTTRTRTEIFAEYFSGAWRSADEAKRMRTRSRAAASACKEVLAITKSFSAADQALVADDLTALNRAFEILDQMGSVFEVAQRRSKAAEAKREADRKTDEESRITALVVEMFGESLDANRVASFAYDLSEFERQIDDFVLANRRAPRGLIDINGNSGAIRDLAGQSKTKDTKDLARLVAKAWSGISNKGHPYSGSDKTITWFAGKDDFLLWRSWRDQVSEKLAAITKL